MTDNGNLGAAALRRLDEDLTQSVMLPPVDAVIRRASSGTAGPCASGWGT